ncbi:MAG: hypothetical protein V1679_00035 [Candidatus Peregrinibacteria bacterium]
MNEEVITVREFLRNFSKFNKKKKTIIISKNGKPEGIFMPYEKWKTAPLTGVNLADAMEKYSFESGEKNLSQKIDEIVYGATNPHRE